MKLMTPRDLAFTYSQAAPIPTQAIESIRGWVAILEQGLARNERAIIYNALRDAVPEFRGEAA